MYIWEASIAVPISGSEFDLGPGNVSYLPSGHAWVVGDDPVVVVDWYGASNCANKKEMTQKHTATDPLPA